MEIFKDLTSTSFNVHMMVQHGSVQKSWRLPGQRGALPPQNSTDALGSLPNSQGQIDHRQDAKFEDQVRQNLQEERK